MNHNSYLSGLLMSGIILLVSCSGQGPGFEPQGNDVPASSADSLYQFVQEQVAFGPRVPNTDAHEQTRRWIDRKLSSFIGPQKVYQQRFKQVVYGDTLNLSNIIASTQPTLSDRIMLCAHWDSRPFADEASTDSLKKLPVTGADDGASGVAVLVELVRLLSEHKAPVGVDIVLFDGEDYGWPEDLDHYFLGSRYWSLNQPVPGYAPRFGILLDMVGAKNATFYKERYSLSEAEGLVDAVWSVAKDVDSEGLFIDETGAYISDDHVVLNQNLSFSTINIVNHNPNRQDKPFADHWHTERDDMEIISKTTLKTVADLMLEIIYNRFPTKSEGS